MSLLVHHFTPLPQVNEVHFQHKSCERVMNISAIVWSRVETLLSESPLEWVLLADPRCTQAEKDELFRSFQNRNLCDLDWGFTRPLREAGATYALLEKAAHHLRKHGWPTNMSLERLLSLIKKSSPSQSRAPNAERILHGGTLSQFQSRHQRGGHDDNRGSTKQLRAKL